MESGTVIAVVLFTGDQASPWWRETWAVLIQGASGVILYGEVQPLDDIKPGYEVAKGQYIGSVVPVLKRNKGRPTTMLHLEWYDEYQPGYEQRDWVFGPGGPFDSSAVGGHDSLPGLCSPLPLLADLATGTFALDQYDGSYCDLDHELDRTGLAWGQWQDNHIRRYYREAESELLFYGWQWVSFRQHAWGWEATYRYCGGRNSTIHPGMEARSAYVYPNAVGLGHYTRWVEGLGQTPVILFGGRCTQVDRWVTAHRPLDVIRLSTDGMFYGLTRCDPDQAYPNAYILARIQDYYAGKYGKRTGLPYMNHIWEGLALLRFLGEDGLTQTAWCLHPLVQSDEAIRDLWIYFLTTDLPQSRFYDADFVRLTNLPRKGSRFYDADFVMLAMEYRRVANSYLPRKGSVETIADFGPLPGVRSMLIADKIQNAKDYRQHRHLFSAEDQDRLDGYFDNWLHHLGVDADFFNLMTSLISKAEGLP